jgi:hypothetical protein
MVKTKNQPSIAKSVLAILIVCCLLGLAFGKQTHTNETLEQNRVYKQAMTDANILFYSKNMMKQNGCMKRQ